MESIGIYLWITYFFINIVSLYTLICYFKTHIEVNNNQRLFTKILISLIYLSINQLTFIGMLNPITKSIMQLGLLLIIALLFKAKLKQKIILTVIFICFMLVVEMMIIYAYSFIMGISVEIATKDDVFIITGTIISKVVALAIIKFIQAYKLTSKQLENISVISLLKTITAPLFSIFIMHIIHKLSFAHQAVEQLVLISISLLALLNVYIFILIEWSKKLEENKYENLLLKAQTEYYLKKQADIDKHNEQIAVVRHDLKHKLLYIKQEFKRSKDITIIEKEINELIGQISPNTVKKYCKNEVFNIILNYKLQLLEERNIPFDFKINISDNIYVDEKNLYVILGNLFDNVLENYNKNDITENVVIRIYEEKQNLYIKISNPYKGKIYYKNGLPKTRKTNNDFHGIGLKSISKIVSNENGDIRIITENNIFTVEIIINCKQ